MRSLVLSLGSVILSSTCQAQTMNWVQVKTRNAPSARLVHGLAYDSVRGRTVLFGGASGADETWEYDGKDWTQMKPRTSPSGRADFSMAFDVARGRTVLFGGAGQVNDTWTWDGKNWTKMSPKNSPSGRVSHRMVYDSTRKRVVLFGGRDLSGSTTKVFNDTWEWDGVNWTKISTPRRPTASYSCGMAYDSGRQRMVFFGGETVQANQSVRFNETWEYDGKWTHVSTNRRPPVRIGFGMVYDQARHRIVMFGGTGGKTFANDTWEYDGRAWTSVNPTTSPLARWDGDMMVYDLRRSRSVIFGGQGKGRGFLADTWEYLSQTLTGSPSTVSIASGGTQTFSLHAGALHASRFYWVFGSITGTSPGVPLASAVGPVTIPLNPDLYTDITIGLANTELLTRTRGTLDASGNGSASLNVPKNLPSAAAGLQLHHAYLVYDARNNFFMASNPVELMLVK